MVLSDCFIGDFPVTQAFGVNPDAYKKFGLNGHDGEDFGCPSGTQVIAATDGIVYKLSFDATGYGNYVEIWDDKQLCVTIYAHLDHATVTLGDRVVKGQLIGISDNTGNSTGPHLHFGVGITDATGIRLNQNNGFSGWINPNTATWQITNPKEPVSSSALVAKERYQQLIDEETALQGFKFAGYQTVDDVIKKVGDLNDENTRIKQEISDAKSQAYAAHDQMAKMAQEDSAAIQAGLDAQGKLNVYVGQLNALLDSLGIPYTNLSIQQEYQAVLTKIDALQANHDELVKNVQPTLDQLFEAAVFKKLQAQTPTLQKILTFLTHYGKTTA